MRYFLQDIILCCSVLHCVAVCCSMLQHVYVTWLVHVTYSTFFKTLYCSVLQCVAVCCSVLQCVAVCWNVLQCVAVCCSTYMWCGSYKWHEAPFPRHYTAVCYSVLQCVAVCCSVLQCVAVCHSVLQCVAVCQIAQHSLVSALTLCCNVLQCVAMCCNVLQCVTVCCSVLQCVAMCFNVLQRAAVHVLLNIFLSVSQHCVHFERVCWCVVECCAHHFFSFFYCMCAGVRTRQFLSSVYMCVCMFACVWTYVCECVGREIAHRSPFFCQCPNTVLQCAVMCCNVLQCITTCCSMLQCVALCCSVLLKILMLVFKQRIAVSCSFFQSLTASC